MLIRAPAVAEASQQQQQQDSVAICFASCALLLLLCCFLRNERRLENEIIYGSIVSCLLLVACWLLGHTQKLLRPFKSSTDRTANAKLSATTTTK